MLLGNGSRQLAGQGSCASTPSRRASRGVIALGASLAILLALPLTSLGSSSPSLKGTVESVLKVVPKVSGAVQSTLKHVTQSASPAPTSHVTTRPAAIQSTAPVHSTAVTHAAPRAGSSSPNTPAMYGTNPHGQGTVGSVQVGPSTNLPYSYSPSGSPGEQVVLGRGRSEQTASGYHAHTTLVDVLGQEIVGVDATQGQSKKGPLDPVQTQILDALCHGTGDMVCLSLLAMDTAATSNGATTHFEVAHATIGGVAHGIDVGVAGSDSSISSSGSCQSASGASHTANVNIGGGPVAGVADSTDSSTACSGQTPTQTASSKVINIGQTGLPLPAAGCANGTPNSVFDLLGLARTICNAYDTTQAATPAGVREALTALVLPGSSTALAKTVVAASESHAVAPASTCTGSNCGGGGNGGGGNGGGGGGNGGGGNGGGGGGNGGNGGNGGSVGGQHQHQCTDADQDCGKGPGGTGTCTNDTADSDGDCVFPGGGSETAFVSESGENGTNGAGNTGASNASSGSLPFTGQDVLKVMLVGLLLAGGGIALGLRTRRIS